MRARKLNQLSEIPNKALRRQLHMLRRTAFIELLCKSFYPLLLAILLLLNLSLFGFFDQIAPSLILPVTIAFLGIGFGWGIRCFVREGKKLSANALMQRHAKQQGWPFLWLELLGDQPVQTSPDPRYLWQEARKKVEAKARKAKPPQTNLSYLKLDPGWSLLSLLILFFLAFFLAGSDLLRRLQLPFNPDFAGDLSQIETHFWIEPPSYVNSAPALLALSEKSEGATPANQPPTAIKVINGSVFRGQISNSRTEAKFELKGIEGTAQLTPERLSENSWSYMSPLNEINQIQMKLKGRVFSWPLHMIEDQRPSIRWTKKPGNHFTDHLIEAEERRQQTQSPETLNGKYFAQDDHGIREIELTIWLLDENKPGRLANLPSDKILIQQFEDGRREFWQSLNLSLAEHPWAGKWVRAALTVRDALGQEAYSTTEQMILPGAIFTQPLARAAQDIRLQLLGNQDAFKPYDPTLEIGRASELANGGLLIRDEALANSRPKKIAWAIDALDSIQLSAILHEPSNSAHLGLALAQSSLANATTTQEVGFASGLLWDTALYIEYGDLASAREALRQAMEALRDALRRGAGADELAQHMANLRGAVNRYLQALAAAGLSEDPGADFAGGSGDGNSMSLDEITQMLEALDDMAQTGATDSAATMLRKLEDLLANLQMQRGSGSGSGMAQGNPNETPEQKELREKIEELSELIDEQRALLDESQRAQSRQQNKAGDIQLGSPLDPRLNPFPPPGTGSGQAAPTPNGENKNGSVGNGSPQQEISEIGAAQKKLQSETENFEAKNRGGGGAVKPKEDLQGAADAMGDAAEALSNQQASEAIEAQRRALNELKTYAQDLTEQAQELGMAGQAPGLQPGEENGGTDPLGRAISGDDGSVGYGDDMLPSERARKRSREILDQLRQKLRDPSLDQASKDYIKRLLERFDGGS